MLTKEQKKLLANALMEELHDIPRLHSIAHLDNATRDDTIEVETWENMLSINLVKIYHTLNIAGLYCTNKQDDVPSHTHNNSKRDNILVDIYTFKFI